MLSLHSDISDNIDRVKVIKKVNIVLLTVWLLVSFRVCCNVTNLAADTGICVITKAASDIKQAVEW